MTVFHVIAAAILGCGAAQPAPMTFTTLDGGDQSQIETPRQAVARTQTEWEALWKAHGAESKPPVVDFTRTMVIGVFLGTRPTAGYAVAITRIEKREKELVVTWRERCPGPRDLVAQVLTAPFVLVRTEPHAGPVRFQRAP